MVWFDLFRSIPSEKTLNFSEMFRKTVFRLSVATSAASLFKTACSAEMFVRRRSLGRSLPLSASSKPKPSDWGLPRARATQSAVSLARWLSAQCFPPGAVGDHHIRLDAFVLQQSIDLSHGMTPLNRRGVLIVLKAIPQKAKFSPGAGGAQTWSRWR